MADGNAVNVAPGTGVSVTYEKSDDAPEVERAFFTALRETEQSADALSRCLTGLLKRLEPMCVPRDPGPPDDDTEVSTVPLVERVERLHRQLDRLASEIESTEKHRLAI